MVEPNVVGNKDLTNSLTSLEVTDNTINDSLAIRQKVETTDTTWDTTTSSISTSPPLKHLLLSILSNTIESLKGPVHIIYLSIQCSTELSVRNRVSDKPIHSSTTVNSLQKEARIIASLKVRGAILNLNRRNVILPIHALALSKLGVHATSSSSEECFICA